MPACLPASPGQRSRAPLLPGWAPSRPAVSRGRCSPSPAPRPPGGKPLFRGGAGHGDGSRQGPAAVRPRRGAGSRRGGSSSCRRGRAAAAFHPCCCRRRPSGRRAEVTASLPGRRRGCRGTLRGEQGSAAPELPACPLSPCPWWGGLFSLNSHHSSGKPLPPTSRLWFPTLNLPQLGPAPSWPWCSPLPPPGPKEGDVFVEVLRLAIGNRHFQVYGRPRFNALFSVWVVGLKLGYMLELRGDRLLLITLSAKY